MFLVLGWASELGPAGCLEPSLMVMVMDLTGRRPGSSYLSETKHPPDEGYIRHALSYSHYHHPLVLDHHHICSLSASGLR